MKKKEVSHDWCDTSFFYLYGRKPVAGKRRRRQLREFAPHSPERLILPLRGANFLQGRGAVGCESLRPAPGKALFFRRGAQTFCREEAPAAAGVCAPFPGKAYFSVERRKPFAGKRRRRLREFAPHSRESLILPLRGANRLPGKGAGGRGSLRLLPGKALFLRREAQTFHPEKPPAAVGVCAPLPGKPYSSVERRKPFTGKSARSQCEFAPPSRESLITPLRGANRLPGKGAAAVGVCASFPGKPYFSVEKRKPFTRKSAGGRGSLRPIPGKALFLRRGAQTLHPEKPPAAVGVCAPLPGKPYSSVEGRKPFTREEPPPAA